MMLKLLLIPLVVVAPLSIRNGAQTACTWLVPTIVLDTIAIRHNVETLLDEPDASIRAEAARAIGRATSVPARREGAPAARVAGGKDVRDAIGIALDDPSMEVRIAAACALGPHGDARALVLLERRRTRATDDLRNAIDLAVARIRARLDAPLLLRGGTVVDGTGSSPQPGTSILIEGDVITRVAPDSELVAPVTARVVDLAGMWITPGLWDMHVHLGKAGADALALFPGTGITSVRDMGGDPGMLLALRSEIGAGERIGPRIVLAGPMLEAPATLERMAGMPTNEPWQRTRIAVEGPDAAAAIVDSVAALGVDFIKVREAADLATYRAIATAARDRNLALAGHAPFGMDVAEGARLGLTTFEHASYPYPLDTAKAVRQQTLQAFRQGGTAIVPTIMAWSTQLMHPDSLAVLIADSSGDRDQRRPLLSAALLQEWSYDFIDREPLEAPSLRGWCGFINRTLADLAAMHDAGIPILPGSDLASPGLFPGWSLHDELEVLVRGGVLTPPEAVRAATSVAAFHAGRGGEVGTVKAGQRADLLVLDADPTIDIAALRQLRRVVLNGVFLDDARISEFRGDIPLDPGPGINLLPGVAEAGCGVLLPRHPRTG